MEKTLFLLEDLPQNSSTYRGAYTGYTWVDMLTRSLVQGRQGRQKVPLPHESNFLLTFSKIFTGAFSKC